MPSAADRIDFGPPRDAGSARAFGFALLAHALLIAALTWGLNWKTTDKSASFEAELWSSVAQEAAPKLVQPPPPPPPPEPVPKAAPEAKAPPPPPAPDPDIALEQEKKRRLQQQKEADAQKALEKQKTEALAKKEKDLKAKQEQARQEQSKQLQAKQEQDKRKALDEAKKLEAKKQEAREQASAAALAAQRNQNLARIMGQAGSSGGENAKGSALKSSGPSASYGGKVRAKVKPNIVFTDDIQGNPSAEVEVRTSPDGSIISQRLVKPSGNKAWDDAVIKAIIRTETMPRDVDGRVPTPMMLVFTPRDL